MKKNLFFLIIAFLFLLEENNVFVLAENATDTAKNNDEKILQIRELKERVAEKVTQLKGGEFKIYQGEITDITEETISLKGKDNQILKIQTNNQTKFIWLNTDGKKLNITLKDFTKEDDIVAWGKANKETGIMTADYVSGRLPPQIFSCLILSFDEEKESFICQFKDKNEYEVLLRENSRILNYQKKDGLKTQKLKQLSKGMKVFVKGILKEKDKNKISGQLVLTLFSVTPSPAPKQN